MPLTVKVVRPKNVCNVARQCCKPLMMFTPTMCMPMIWRGPQCFQCGADARLRVVHVSDDSDMLMGDYMDWAADLWQLPRPPRISRSASANRIARHDTELHG